MIILGLNVSFLGEIFPSGFQGAEMLLSERKLVINTKFDSYMRRIYTSSYTQLLYYNLFKVITLMFEIILLVVLFSVSCPSSCMRFWPELHTAHWRRDRWESTACWMSRSSVQPTLCMRWDPPEVLLWVHVHTTEKLSFLFPWRWRIC